MKVKDNRALDERRLHEVELPELPDGVRVPDDLRDLDDVGRRRTITGVRWLRWTAPLVVLVLAVAAIVMVAGTRTDDEVEYIVPRTADGTEHWIDATTPDVAVPRTADGTERWIVATTPVYAVPQTADGAEHRTDATTPDYAVPQTADGAEHRTDEVTP